MTPTAIMFVVSAIILASLWRIVARAKTKDPANDIAFTLITELFACGTGLVLLIITGFDLTVPISVQVWGLFAISILVATLGDYLLLISTKYADLADTSILIPLSNFWTLLLAYVFLAESVSLEKALAVGLIIIGSMLALMKTGKITVNKGIIAIFFYGISAALMNTIDKGISDQFSIPLYATISYGASAVLLYAFLGKKRATIATTEWNKQGWWLGAVGVMWSLFSFMLLSAYRYMEVSTVVPLMRFFIVITTLYSLFVLKEKTRFVQKIVGSLLVTSGAVILAFVQ